MINWRHLLGTLAVAMSLSLGSIALASAGSLNVGSQEQFTSDDTPTEWSAPIFIAYVDANTPCWNFIPAGLVPLRAVSGLSA